MLRRPLLLTTLVVVATACNKRPEAGSGAPSASSSNGATVAAGARADGGQSLASGFEGLIVLRESGLGGGHDVLFFTKGGKLRVEIPAPNGTVSHSIFDPATSKVYFIAENQHMVMERTIPPLPPHTAASPTVTRTGKHETISGYDCEDWNIASPDGSRSAVCVASGISFFDFAGVAARPGVASWADELRAANGFPLRAVETDASGKELSRLEVTRVDPRSLIDETFQIPQGYAVMSAEKGHGGPPGAAPR
jgi:hypothetical protein